MTKSMMDLAEFNGLDRTDVDEMPTRRDDHSMPTRMRHAISPKVPIKKSPVHQRGKKLQMQQTLSWLDENYVVCDGVCLPRCILYAHYLDFCRQNKFSPSCAATFGKTIRQKFPQLTTRRLGTRGHSKYHYYGIAIKESSVYYHTVYSGKGLTRFSGLKLEGDEEFSRQLSLTTKTGTLLPEFPDPKNMKFSHQINSNKLETFLLMYKTHCQCILDTTITGNYMEIRHFILHFWKGMPLHLTTLFEQEEVVDLVCVCDSILYKVLTDVLVPISVHEASEDLLSEVRQFSRQLEPWLKEAISFKVETLKSRKLQVLHRFVQSIKRQTSFLHLAKTSRSVLSNRTLLDQLVHDLDKIDIRSMDAQAQYTTSDCQQDQVDLHEGYLRELKELLAEEGAIETYIEWLECIVQTQVTKSRDVELLALKHRAQEFLLSWSFFGARIMYSLTLSASKAFGSFHLVRLLLDEYILLILESQLSKEEENELQARLDKLWQQNGSQDSTGLRVSVVITRTKFGAPSPGKLTKKKLQQQTGLAGNSSRSKKKGRRHLETSSSIHQSNGDAIVKAEEFTAWQSHIAASGGIYGGCVNEEHGLSLPCQPTVLTPPISPDVNWHSTYGRLALPKDNNNNNNNCINNDRDGDVIQKMRQPYVNVKGIANDLFIASRGGITNHCHEALSAQVPQHHGIGSSNVASMVEEHFRHCGYAMFDDASMTADQHHMPMESNAMFPDDVMFYDHEGHSSSFEIATMADAIARDSASYSAMTSMCSYPTQDVFSSTLAAGAVYGIDHGDSNVGYTYPVLPSINSLLAAD